ncbi:TetR/AcrR family transcriptional regulator [Curtobacterium sp. MWU13-2055]|uniref:TetR/AcrR family transcriptional regulator n=1 Tax=Curtobacterium sp. MWU13-2055 TaxID=2931928 RepID=UPI00200F2A73|nr:TetR/AcrR family transcriptional regulator [Curtobacterium sp. MWU13-2055]
MLNAASRVFAARGTAATLNDVARDAGVGIGTVYRKFADKEAVLDALFDEKVAMLIGFAHEADAVDDAGAAVRGLLLAVMQLRATDRGLEAVLTSAGRDVQFSEVLGREFIPIVHRLILRAIEAGEIRAEFSADEVCLLGFMVGRVADITHDQDPDVWRRYAQFLIHGLRPAPAHGLPAPLSFADSAIALGRAN